MCRERASFSGGKRDCSDTFSCCGCCCGVVGTFSDEFFLGLPRFLASTKQHSFAIPMSTQREQGMVLEHARCLSAHCLQVLLNSVLLLLLLLVICFVFFAVCRIGERDKKEHDSHASSQNENATPGVIICM